ncbi:MAG: CoA transferase [Chloroflexota bacterium]|nr:MAG: CoA transferase [Chloroflexota bacterium]
MTALTGIRVLDMTRVGPGPFCSMLLADLGADVLMIEQPPASKDVPAEQAHLEARDPEAAAALPERRNKRSISINLREPRGLDIVRRLVASADVVIEGGKPGAAARLGTDYKALKAINPRLVYCAITGYGQDGPYAKLAGGEINFVALAGVLPMILQSGVRPSFPGGLIGDYAGGAMMATVAILAALMARTRTGRGQFIDLAMADGVLSLTTLLAGLSTFSTGKDPVALSHAMTGGAPYYTAYQTKDGQWLSIGAVGERFFRNLCDGLERADLLELYYNGESTKLYEEMKSIFTTRTRDEWFALLAKHDTGVSPVYTFSEAARDPHLLHRKMFVEVPSATKRNVQIGVAPKLSDTPGEIRWPGRPRGADSEAVLRELGLADDEAHLLFREGVIYTWHPGKS